MSTHIVECRLSLRRPGKGKGSSPPVGYPTESEAEQGSRRPRCVERGRVPRVARLMALAVRFEQLVRSGAVRDYAGLAKLGRVSRARITQIMNLLHLAPDLQERVLFLPRVESGRDAVYLDQLQPLAGILDWRAQRRKCN